MHSRQKVENLTVCLYAQLCNNRRLQLRVKMGNFYHESYAEIDFPMGCFICLPMVGEWSNLLFPQLGQLEQCQLMESSRLRGNRYGYLSVHERHSKNRGWL